MAPGAIWNCAGVGYTQGEYKMATIDDFRKLEFRIAQIKEVSDHPNADKLVVLTLDLGDRQKQVVAGIKLHYSKEELIGKQVVVVDNLDAVVLRGVESQGMILAGSDENILAVVSPDKTLKLGSIVK
jgi:methionine--tRNA ligase beta chain